jgi:ABC-2 type transport system permease protein
MTDAVRPQLTKLAPRRLPLRSGIVDTGVIVRRTVRRHLRTPQLLFFATVQPVMFVLLFNYAFGGEVKVPTRNYVDYLMPGIFIQTVAFGGINTAMGLTSDVATGIVGRFRALPMARIAILAGRTVGDAVRNVAVVALMVVVGLLLGFRFHGGPLRAVVAMLFAPLFGFAVAWVFAYIGLAMKGPETAQLAGFALLFPLVFMSGAFSPITAMPSWLQIVVRNQPFTQVVNAMRALTQGGPLAHAVTASLIWMSGMIIVFAGLSVRRYRRG